MLTLSNHLFLLYSPPEQSSRLFWWNIDTPTASNLLIGIDSIFGDLYDMDIPLNTWAAILNHLFDAKDVTKQLPVFVKQYQLETQEIIDNNEKLPSGIMVKSMNTNNNTENQLITTIITSLLRDSQLNDRYMQLTTKQVNWLTRVFLGKTKLPKLS